MTNLIAHGWWRKGRRQSLLFELKTLPLKWEGMKRCIQFWVKVMKMGEDRLLKQVMMEVMELEDGVQWRQDLERSVRMFGCEGLRAEGLNSLSMSEVRQMLRDVAWREAVDSWREQARSHLKLAEV